MRPQVPASLRSQWLRKGSRATMRHNVVPKKNLIQFWQSDSLMDTTEKKRALSKSTSCLSWRKSLPSWRSISSTTDNKTMLEIVGIVASIEIFEIWSCEPVFDIILWLGELIFDHKRTQLWWLLSGSQKTTIGRKEERIFLDNFGMFYETHAKLLNTSFIRR